MNEEDAREPKESKHPLRYPWWEPYLYTGAVIIVIGISCFAFSFIARAVSYFEPIMFGVATALVFVSVLRRKTSNPRVIGKVLMTMFFMIASIAYVSNAERVIGLAFAAMALVWFCLSVHAGITKRLQREERLAKLDRAVNSLDRAMRKVNGNEN